MCYGKGEQTRMEQLLPQPGISPNLQQSGTVHVFPPLWDTISMSHIWTPSCWAPCNQHTRQLLKEGMGDGLHHIIAIHGHEMAFLPQWCPSDMPVPSTAAPSAHRSTHPGSAFYCRNGSGLEENLWQGHNLQSIYERNKHRDYLVWFKWWLLLKCPVLLLNTMILQLEANSSAGGHRNVSPATFYWEVWTERIIAFIGLPTLCAWQYFISVPAKDTEGIKDSFMKSVCMHLLPVVVSTSSISSLQYHACSHCYAMQELSKDSCCWISAKMSHWASHTATCFIQITI